MIKTMDIKPIITHPKVSFSSRLKICLALSQAKQKTIECVPRNPISVKLSTKFILTLMCGALNKQIKRITRFGIHTEMVYSIGI
mmetsp:Transcript_1272/g.1154  ORF Transcript_1272/g.1154 Transcript_1272/m.1154 type:complete len:84 (-) Transcript_1272:658-909(-)